MSTNDTFVSLKEVSFLYGKQIILDNSYFALVNAKEQLRFYEKCIQIRQLMMLENQENE